MSIENNLEIIKLIDTYGKLLTERQNMIIRDYYFDNLTLAEIGDNYGISRQAVKDSINKSLKIFNDLEDKLKVCQKQDNITNELSEIVKLVDSEELKDKISKIIDYIRS